MNEEMLDVVDDNDKVVDVKPKSEVEDKVLIHRGAKIILLNSKNEIFVHQRSKIKKNYPLYWAIFLGGFVSSGETYEQAAIRELEEEIGIKADKLEFLTDFRFKVVDDNWFGKLFRAVSDEKVKLQEEELEQGYFIPIKDLDNFVKTHKMKRSDLYIYKNFKKLIK